MNSCLKIIRLFLFSLFITALFAFVFTGIAKASDQTITCISTDCSGLSGALFTETNLAPGDSITRVLHILNTTNPDSCNLTMSATTPLTTGNAGSSDFTTKLFTAIYDGSSDVYGVRDVTGKATNSKTLGNLYGDTPIFLGSIVAGGNRDYNWTVYFDKDSDNTYQAASTKFDLNLTFVCGNPPAFNPGEGGDGDGDGSDGDTGGESAITSAVAGIATQLGFRGPPLFFEEVAGTSTPATSQPEIVPPEDEGAGKVKGVSACVDPKLWWVLFIVQFLLGYLFYRRVNKQNMHKKRWHFFFQVVNDLVFMFIFWKYFCPWWDVLVSALIGVFWLTLLKRKIDKL